MRRFPSVKDVLFCGFAAVVLVMAVPTSPHTARSLHSEGDVVATMASANSTSGQTASGTKQTQNSSSKANNKAKQAQPPAKQKSGNSANQTNPAENSAEQLQKTDLDGNSSTSDPPEQVTAYTKPKMAKLRIHVIDGRNQKSISGAEVVVIETEKRYKTDAQGYTPWFDAPVLRHPKYRPMVQELHGQLGVIVYKNGYRDSVHLGIRMHEDIKQQSTVWMYKLGPEDRRVEPVLYQEPYHHIWLIQLADKFRQKSQIGEGPERP